MARCTVCNRSSSLISGALGICLQCIRERPTEALRQAANAHARIRMVEGLPAVAPDDPLGKPCRLCGNECRIAEGQSGYCGLKKNEAGSLAGISEKFGKLSWYHDPLPTNCVGDWVCAGGTGSGYP